MLHLLHTARFSVIDPHRMMHTCGLTDEFVLTGIIALTYGQVSVNATRCKKFALRVELLLNHRLGWPRGGYGVCVSMHDLPGSLFESEDACDAQCHGGNILPSANPGPVALHLHDVAKLRGYVLRYILEAYDLATPVTRGGTLQSLSSLIPSAHGRTERIGKAHVFPTGEELLIGLGVSLDKLARHEVILLDYVVKLLYPGHLRDILHRVDPLSFP